MSFELSLNAVNYSLDIGLVSIHECLLEAGTEVTEFLPSLYDTVPGHMIGAKSQKSVFDCILDVRNIISPYLQHAIVLAPMLAPIAFLLYE